MVHRGIVLYDIEMDGCWNGVYVNEQSPTAGVVFNEMVRKRRSQTQQPGITGRYDCVYFETSASGQNVQRRAILTVTQAHATNVYNFVWSGGNPSRTLFRGTGYEMNPRQIAVHYTGNG